MGKARGINSGGGESSLGYLFGSGKSVSKPTKPAVNTSFTTTTTTPTTTNGAGGRLTTTTTTNTITGDKNMTEEEKKKEMSAGVRGSPNNYLRTEGQNCGNFLTVIIILLSLLIIRIKNVVFIFFCEKQDRPSTKVHAAPGGGSSLGYLFGSGSGK
ncbi:unnamed protein product [Brassica oleracea var. botrytis]|uniref:(rape) hypothetical protein n=1 Tax=Brassica napus TaxID=3708 RepID=A0A816J0T6_BRANA|nr:protein SPIRAL1-like 4 isoform X1 [Brassica napus]CAF1783281.1 unnamed protein product [Brassica napus]